MWGTTSSCAKLTGDSGGAFEALLIGDCRSLRPLAGKWPLRLLGLLQHYPSMNGRRQPAQACRFRWHKQTFGGLETFAIPRYAPEGLRNEIGPAAGKLKGTVRCISG